LAEEQIRSGTATAQVITHFLKLGTEREKLERKRLEGENRLLEAKVESLASSSRIEELYEKAVAAMRSYAGRGSVDESEG
jgi:cell division protein FtsL